MPPVAITVTFCPSSSSILSNWLYFATRSDLEGATRVHLTISAEDFRGGVRAVIRSRNILIDNSFSTQLKEQYDKFVFLGGDGIA